jgi:hypothetical protein
MSTIQIVSLVAGVFLLGYLFGGLRQMGKYLQLQDKHIALLCEYSDFTKQAHHDLQILSRGMDTHVDNLRQIEASLNKTNPGGPR